MKITDMHVTPIAITDPPLLNAAGLHAPYALRTIIEIVTDDNIYGLGEVPGSVATTEALEAARALVIGQDPFQLNAIQQGLFDHFGVEGASERGESPWDKRRIVHVYSAIEVALFDIMGKATGRPVCDLLGGRARPDVFRPIRQRQLSAPAVLVVLERTHVIEPIGCGIRALAVKATVPETAEVLPAVAIRMRALAVGLIAAYLADILPAIRISICSLAVRYAVLEGSDIAFAVRHRPLARTVRPRLLAVRQRASGPLLCDCAARGHRHRARKYLKKCDLHPLAFYR